MVGLMIGCSGTSFANEGDGEYYELSVPPSSLPVSLPHNDIVLTEGWSLIAIPVLPDKPLTVRGFMGMIADDWEITVVAVFKNGQFERYPKEGITYNMVPGESYFVHAEYSGILSGRRKTAIGIEGSRPEIPVTLSLDRGWNGISLMCYRDGGWAAIVGSLRTLSRELQDQGINATKIALWDADNQTWEEYELPFEGLFPRGEPVPAIFPLPDDPAIYSIEGFFLLCEENGLYIPGLDAGAPTVDPPFPEPLRLSGENEMIQKAKDDLCERLDIREEDIGDVNSVMIANIASRDWPVPSATSDIFEISLAHAKNTHIYEGRVHTTTRYIYHGSAMEKFDPDLLEIISTERTVEVEYKG